MESTLASWTKPKSSISYLPSGLPFWMSLRLKTCRWATLLIDDQT